MKDSDPQEMEKQMRHTVLPACSLQRVSCMGHKQGIPSRAQLITQNSGGSGKRPGISRQLWFMDKVPKMGELHKRKFQGPAKNSSWVLNWVLIGTFLWENCKNLEGVPLQRSQLCWLVTHTGWKVVPVPTSHTKNLRNHSALGRVHKTALPQWWWWFSR